MVISGLLGLLIKALINRPRPFEVLNITNLINVGSSSFPSGHTIAAFTALALLYRGYPKLRHLWFVLALLIGFSRIYLGVHFLTDVAVGALIGYVIGNTTVYYYEKRLKNKEKGKSSVRKKKIKK